MIGSRLTPAAAAMAALGLLAGCGSSSSSSSKAASSGSSASSSASPSSSSGYGSAAATSTTTKSPAATSKPVVLTTKHSKLGTILAAGDKRLTVYLFEADKGPQSSCSGACATVWPPVLGKPSASGGAHASDLGTITRTGGTTQVTYKGHPLYYFLKDKDDGDAYGQGLKSFGAGWYVLSPSGSKVDES